MLVISRFRKVFQIGFILSLFATLAVTGCGGGGATSTSTSTYSVGGILTGLISGNSITLTNNATDNLTLTADGAFTFATKLANATTYNLTLAQTTPTPQPCTSTNGSGAINAANVTNLNVFCGLPGGLGTFTSTGSLTTARSDHTATLLPNGKVLLSGGFTTYFASASAELYDPVAGTWTSTGFLTTARRLHSATLLPNGKVLISGGVDAGYSALASAELYDPVAETWAATGLLATARFGHTATLLPNGKVLVSGGVTAPGVLLASAELYDPVTGTWTATGSLRTAREGHTATLLPNGKVFVSGGANAAGALASAELYDPVTGTWAATGSLATARSAHTATLLPNGKVLISGGDLVIIGSIVSIYVFSSAELYDPATGTWVATGSLATARYGHTATLLPNGKVLVSGGSWYNNGTFLGGVLASAELYDPVAGTWSATGSLARARSAHTATPFPNGKVLISGGSDGNYALASAELYF